MLGDKRDDYDLWYDRVGEYDFIVNVSFGPRVIASCDNWEEALEIVDQMVNMPGSVRKEHYPEIIRTYTTYTHCGSTDEDCVCSSDYACRCLRRHYYDGIAEFETGFGGGRTWTRSIKYRVCIKCNTEFEVPYSRGRNSTRKTCGC